MAEIEYKKSIKEISLILKIVSNIRRYDKLYIYDNDKLRIDDRYFKSLKRLYTNDDRYKSLDFLDEKLTTLSSDINTLLTIRDPLQNMSVVDQDNNELCQGIILDLENAKKGIINLRETYSDDVC